MKDVYSRSQPVIDNVIEFCQVNQIEGDALTCALLQLMASTMKASGTFENGLNDQDGVCILHVRLY